MKYNLPKTVNTREVVPGKLYNIKVFDEAGNAEYGIARILMTRIYDPCIPILFNDGTIGHRDISEIIWLNQV